MTDPDATNVGATRETARSAPLDKPPYGGPDGHVCGEHENETLLQQVQETARSGRGQIGKHRQRGFVLTAWCPKCESWITWNETRPERNPGK